MSSQSSQTSQSGQTVEPARTALLRIAEDVTPDRLGRGDRVDELTEIGRLSVHVAAVEQTVAQVARRVLPDGSQQVGELVRRSADLSSALFRLDRKISGDARRARDGFDDLVAAATAATAAYAERERALLHALADALDDAGATALAESFHTAAMRVPTRPHPTLSAHRTLKRLTWWLAAPVDRFRDSVDNRPVPEQVEAQSYASLARLGTPAPTRVPALAAA